MAMLVERADGLPFMVEELRSPSDSRRRTSHLAGPGGGPVREAGRRPASGASGAAVLGLTPDWSLLHRRHGRLRDRGAGRVAGGGGGSAARWSSGHPALASLADPEAVLRWCCRRSWRCCPDVRPRRCSAWTARGRRGCRRPAAAGRCRRRRRRPAAHPGPSRRGAGGLPHGRAAPRRPGTDRTAARGSRGRARSAALPPRARTRGPGGGGSGARRCHGGEHVELALQLARAAVQAGLWADVREYVERAGRPEDPRSETLLADAAHGAGQLDDAARHAAAAVRGGRGGGRRRTAVRRPGGAREGAPALGHAGSARALRPRGAGGRRARAGRRQGRGDAGPGDARDAGDRDDPSASRLRASLRSRPVSSASSPRSTCSASTPWSCPTARRPPYRSRGSSSIAAARCRCRRRPSAALS